MNYEIPNFTARMKVCKDLKLIEKNVESQDSTFFALWCGNKVLWGMSINVCKVIKEKNV